MTELARLKTLDTHHWQVKLAAEFGVDNQVVDFFFGAGLTKKGPDVVTVRGVGALDS